MGGIDFFGKENGGIFVSETAEQGRSDGDKVVRLFALAVLGGVEVKGTTAEK